MKILVTGAAGRIGQAIVLRLRAEHAVVGLDLQPSATTDQRGSITDPACLRRALRGVQAVVHCAALHAPHVGQVADAEFDRVNRQATADLARLAMDSGAQRLVLTSTTALYGAGAAPGTAAAWVDERSVPQPQTVYHRSKLAAEAALAQATHGSGLAVTVLRMSRCFAEPAPLMAVYRLHRGISARDAAQAHALALRRAEPGFVCWVVSGATPFLPADAPELLHHAPAVIARRAPALALAFARRGWPLPRSIDRVYCPARVMRALGWQPQDGFDAVLALLDQGSPDVLPA